MAHAAPPRTAAARAPVPMAGHCRPVLPQETLKHSKAGLVLSLVEVIALTLESWWARGFVGAQQASLVGLRFDFKCSCTPPTILLGLLL